MPYLPFDLEAMRRVPTVALAAGVEPGTIAWGLLRLWQHAWEAKRAVVSDVTLRGCFGPDPRIAEALEDQGFIERTEGGWRVKGAERYLRISEARSKAGKGRASSAKRDASGRLVAGDCAGPEPEPTSKSPAHAGEPASNEPALSSSIQHPASNLESKTTPLSAEPTVELDGDPGPQSNGADPPTEKRSGKDRRRTADAQRVFEHWCRVMGKTRRVVFDSGRQTKVHARLSEGYTADELCQAVDGCAVTPHNMGENERRERYDDLELICRSGSHVERFIANARRAVAPANVTELLRANFPDEKQASLKPWSKANG